MKSLFTFLLLSSCFVTQAQRVSDKRITSDGRSLHIRIDMQQAGRSLHYNRSFDVETMSDEAIKTLESHVVDSLNQVMMDQSSTAASSRTYSDQTRRYERQKYTTYSSTYSATHDNYTQANASSALSPSDVTPTSVLVREDKEHGRLWMQYTFAKDGEELIIERTANVIGKTEKEKQAIIKETERSFGIKLGNQ